jgi:hypothetical protein
MKRWFVLVTLCVATAVFAQPVEVAPGVLQLGTIQSGDIPESSGIEAARVRGLYWTHNDSGPDRLFAVDTAGETRATYDLQGTDIEDLEDIASAGGRLYLADIGNNTENRERVDVHVIREPNVRRSGEARVLRRIRLEYPNNPFDAEALVISGSYGYVIRKESGNARVYRFRLNRSTATLEEICELNVGAPVTGADLSADKRRLAVITGAGAYLFSLRRGFPTSGTLEPTLFVPFGKEQMEACTFTREGLVTTAESGEIYLFTDPAFRSR